MNRNVESYFSTTANIDLQRSTFDRSQDIKFSFNVGKLIPFFIDEVLPGDTFSITTSKVVRLQTLLTPVMDNIYLDTYFFFVPNRLVWTHWKNFMGESESAWTPEVEYKVPMNILTYAPEEANGDPVDRRVKPGDFADYLGVPVNVPMEATTTQRTQVLDTGEYFEFSALIYRGYKLIWSEFFRDENLQDPQNITTGDQNGGYNKASDDRETLSNGVGCFPVDKYHDYFTSALPAPVKGVPVLAPVTTSSYLDTTDLNDGYMKVSGVSSTGTTFTNAYFGTSPFGQNTYAPVRISTQAPTEAGSGINNIIAPSNLGVNIMSLRNAFQIQKLLERDARGGTRYQEIIKAHFNVTSPDARLQRPEYLGGNRVPISIHQITNQSQGENDFLGDLGAMSLTTDKHSDFTQSFTEHGYIFGLCCARYDHSYPQGMERMFSRKTRYDFYWPELAHISEQAIYNKEIYAQGDTSVDNAVFGYQEAWADYRFKPNRVAGEMRPGISNSLASWHFADYYESQPYLSDSWIREDKTNVDRTLAVTSQLANQVFCDVYVQNFTTRPMPVRSIPGLADHF